jgi:glutathione S-transferase
VKLYVTETSPYSRIVRIVVLEKGLQDRVEIVAARTREAGSPYYAINPSGRVPCLVRDDGSAFEDSALICDWLDRLSGPPMFALPQGEAQWEPRRLEARARSLLDGIAVWAREMRRPEHERSPTVIRHETDRAARLTDWWENEIGHPWMQGPLNMAQIALACAYGFEAHAPGLTWRPGHPRLAAWHAALSERPSLAATAPPARR